MSVSVEEDFLETDPVIRGQSYCCLSFVSPEEVLKNKDVFMVGKFLQNIGKRYRDLETLLHKHITDLDRAKHEVSEFKMTNDELQERYKDFLYVNQDKLESEFYEENDFKTTVRGVKIRGSYDTLIEAQSKAKKLQQTDKNFNVYIGQVGFWLPWDPNPHKIDNQEYAEKELNTLVQKYNENQEKKDVHFQENIEYAKEQSELQKRDKDRLDKDQSEKDLLDKDQQDETKISIDKSTENDNETVVNTESDATNISEVLNDVDPWLKNKQQVERTD